MSRRELARLRIVLTVAWQGLRYISCVDLDRGGLRIEATRIIVDGRVVDSSPKTAAGRRWVPLDKALVATLRAHRRRQSEDRLAVGSAWEQTGHVFTNELGQPYYPGFFSVQFRALVRQTGLRRRRLHDTRHTACSVMLLGGAQPFEVARILGHSSTYMVEQVYRHLMGDELERAGEAASRLLLAPLAPSVTKP
jgi:integrase